MKHIKTLEDLFAIAKVGSKIAVRVDFNVPFDKDGNIADTFRIDESLETINSLMNKGMRTAILCHLEKDEELISVKALIPYLEKKLGKKVVYIYDCILEEVDNILSGINPRKELVILENVRFHKEEKKGDFEFAKLLARPFDYFVMDGFGVCHRPHSSILIGEILPAFAGLLMEKELKFLGALESLPENNMVIVGGSKVSTKLELLTSLIGKFETVAIVGGLSHTFLKAQGLEVLNSSNSRAEDSMLEKAIEILNFAKTKGCNIILPVDVVVNNKEKNKIMNVKLEDFPTEEGWEIMDCGEETIDKIGWEIAGAKFILWNGPLGVFEVHPFDEATNMIADFISNQTLFSNATTIVGGGDTAKAIKSWIERVAVYEDTNGLFTWISTGGGASLELLEGKELPGIKILKK